MLTTHSTSSIGYYTSWNYICMNRHIQNMQWFLNSYFFKSLCYASILLELVIGINNSQSWSHILLFLAAQLTTLSLDFNTVQLNFNLTLPCNEHACFHKFFTWNYLIFLFLLALFGMHTCAFLQVIYVCTWVCTSQVRSQLH